MGKQISEPVLRLRFRINRQECHTAEPVRPGKPSSRFIEALGLQPGTILSIQTYDLREEIGRVPPPVLLRLFEVGIYSDPTAFLNAEDHERLGVRDIVTPNG
jgi:hypothetical protein